MQTMHINETNFHEEVLNSEKPVLLDFYAPWCGPCRMVAPILEEIAAENPHIKVGKVNVDTEEALARQNAEAEFALFKDWRAADAAQTAQPAQPAAASAVRLRWADEALKGALDHETFHATKEQQQIEVAICADSPVRKVKVLQLDFAGVDDSGKVSFNSAELFHKATLEPRYPLVIAIPFFENIPQFGISYEDENGRTHRFAITQSGKDGSLQLMPF